VCHQPISSESLNTSSSNLPRSNFSAWARMSACCALMHYERSYGRRDGCDGFFFHISLTNPGKHRHASTRLPSIGHGFATPFVLKFDFGLFHTEILIRRADRPGCASVMDGQRMDALPNRYERSSANHVAVVSQPLWCSIDDSLEVATCSLPGNYPGDIWTPCSSARSRRPVCLGEASSVTRK
jgi:hypothetical protein